MHVGYYWDSIMILILGKKVRVNSVLKWIGISNWKLVRVILKKVGRGCVFR